MLLPAQALSLPHVRHGFTTRAGGVSRGALGSLNLARRPAEREEHLVENWRRVSAALGARTEDLVLSSQVHGRRVLEVERGTGPLAVVGECDALVTTTPGLVLATRAADCVPVLLATRAAPRPGVAAVHSGWRGTALGVVEAAVDALCAASGARPAALVAAIGPCISGEAYTVGPEVVAALRDQAGLAPESFLLPGPRVDLGAAVAAQLRRAGVEEVERLACCTVGDERFFSHRREGDATGRFAGVIRLAA
ncbi:MAG: polyphenol oxidase family protein [Planctomycetota bacterium]